MTALRHLTVSGDLQSITDPKNQVKNYAYNLDDTLAGVNYSGAIVSTPSVAFGYDTNYNRVTMKSDGTGITLYNYYPVTGGVALGAGQLETVSNLFANATITYQYDDLGRMTNRAIDGVAEQYAFDGLDRETNHVSVLGAFAMTYTNGYELASLNYPNELQTDYQYASALGDDRLLTIDTVQDAPWEWQYGMLAEQEDTYSYDTLGRITQEFPWTEVAIEQYVAQIYFQENDVSYDAEGELTDVNPINGGGTYASYSYGYDAAGNRISEQAASANGGPVQAGEMSYNNLNQLTSRSGSGPLPVYFRGTLNEYATVTVTNQLATLLNTNYAFAATVELPLGTNEIPVVATAVNGDKTTNNYSLTVAGEAGKTYAYDSDGNCTNVSMAGTNITYTWDAENRLATINTYVTNTATLQSSKFTYDGFDQWAQIIEETNGVAGSTNRFVWCDSKVCQERDGGNNVQKRFFDEGEQIAGNNYYFFRDLLGSVQDMVDADGYVRAQYDYDPYGQQTQVGGDMASDFGYAGYYYHAPSGLNLTVYRAYDSSSGRWPNQDPIEEEGGINLYEYVGNNPINEIDPFGLQDGMANPANDAAIDAAFGNDAPGALTTAERNAANDVFGNGLKDSENISQDACKKLGKDLLKKLEQKAKDGIKRIGEKLKNPLDENARQAQLKAAQVQVNRLNAIQKALRDLQ